ncbi:MAG: thioesterase [Acidimicrobiia bacterium]|nr:thioesterase [Acidimicrobiia bacterium]
MRAAGNWHRTRVILEPGLSGSASLQVGVDDTAKALHSGDVEVLGSPRVVALAEEASIAAVAGALPPGQTTVGMRFQLDHLAPAAIGATVTADATLEKVEGRRLTFTVSINDERGLVACGKVTRVVVETDRFLDKSR